MNLAISFPRLLNRWAVSWVLQFRFAATRPWVPRLVFSSRRRHTICTGDWSSDVCSSDLITVPLVKSTTLYLVVLYTIASFEVFERIYVMVPSGVGNAAQTIVTQIYANGFKEFDFGVASEIGRASCRERVKSTEVDMSLHK